MQLVLHVSGIPLLILIYGPKMPKPNILHWVYMCIGIFSKKLGFPVSRATWPLLVFIPDYFTLLYLVICNFLLSERIIVCLFVIK